MKIFTKGYRKAKHAMYNATDLMGQGGWRAVAGRTIYATVWATMLIAITIIYILTLGGLLIKEDV